MSTMEQFNKIKSKNQERESMEEKESETRTIEYVDLVKMYYYGTLASQNPFYERHFDKATQKVKTILLKYTKDYIEHCATNQPIETPEGALDSYIESFNRDLENENNSKKLLQIINAFIMYVHERLRINLGEEFLGFSDEAFEGLNYIDTTRPLDEQEWIIHNKLLELYDDD